MASRTIFEVDDEPLVTEIVTRFIVDAGYVVESVTDSVEALNRISADVHRYGVLITDNKMPGMSGRELIEKVRKAGFPGKVIMFSGNAMPGESAGNFSTGADLVLHKPSELKRLVPAIRDLLGY